MAACRVVVFMVLFGLVFVAWLSSRCKRRVARRGSAGNLPCRKAARHWPGSASQAGSEGGGSERPAGGVWRHVHAIDQLRALEGRAREVGFDKRALGEPGAAKAAPGQASVIEGLTDPSGQRVHVTS